MTDARIVLIMGLREFFFKAMSEGYASGTWAMPVPDMPGYKQVLFSDDEFNLVDRWVESSPRSVGTTIIWFRKEPVWVMNYGGSYEKEALPFLRRALLQSYEAGVFMGGRGPRFYPEKDFVYTNLVRLPDFRKFEGREEIFKLEDGAPLGFHEYSGMSLF